MSVFSLRVAALQVSIIIATSSLHNSIHPPGTEINPPKTACGCPCGGVIWKQQQTTRRRKRNKTKKYGHTRSPRTLWNAFVNLQIAYIIPDDPLHFSAGDRYDNIIIIIIVIIIIINPTDDDEDMFDKSAVYKRHKKRTTRQFVTWKRRKILPPTFTFGYAGVATRVTRVHVTRVLVSVIHEVSLFFSQIFGWRSNRGQVQHPGLDATSSSRKLLDTLPHDSGTFPAATTSRTVCLPAYSAAFRYSSGWIVSKKK